jgi:hypothetical protein
MLNRRKFLRLLPGVVAISFAATPALGQSNHGPNGEPATPPPTLTMEQVSRELATHTMQIGVGLSMIRAMGIEIRKIARKQGNPGPHPERLGNT